MTPRIALAALVLFIITTPVFAGSVVPPESLESTFRAHGTAFRTATNEICVDGGSQITAVAVILTLHNDNVPVEPTTVGVRQLRSSDGTLLDATLTPLAVPTTCLTIEAQPVNIVTRTDEEEGAEDEPKLGIPNDWYLDVIDLNPEKTEKADGLTGLGVPSDWYVALEINGNTVEIVFGGTHQSLLGFPKIVEGSPNCIQQPFFSGIPLDPSFDEFRVQRVTVNVPPGTEPGAITGVGPIFLSSSVRLSESPDDGDVYRLEVAGSGALVANGNTLCVENAQHILGDEVGTNDPNLLVSSASELGGLPDQIVSDGSLLEDFGFPADPPAGLLFRDGFEGGDLTSWSFVSP